MESSPAYKKAMKSGHTAAWERRWQDAAGHYQSALDAAPGDYLATVALALANYEMQDYPAALAQYQQAAKIDPDDPMPVEKTARIYQAQGKKAESVKAFIEAAELYLKARDVDKAVANFIYALQVDPNNINAHTRLAVIFEKTMHKAEAVHEYIAVASLLQRRSDAARALQFVQHAAALMPEHPEARQALELVRTNQQLPAPTAPKTPTGSGGLTRHAQIDGPRVEPDTPDPITEARQKALSQLAVRLFDQAEESETPGQVTRGGITRITRGTGALSLENAERERIKNHLSQAIDSLTQGADQAALEDFERAGDLGLNQPGLHFVIGQLQLATDPVHALRRLQIAVQHPDFSLGAYLLMGQLHFAAGRLGEASAAYLQALRLADGETVSASQRDDLMQLYEPLVGAALQSEDTKKQTSLCESVAAQLMRPNWRQAVRAARAELTTHQDDSTPMPLAEMMLQTSSAQVVEALSRIRRLSAQGKYALATEEALQSLQFAPTYLPLHTQIAELLAQNGKTEDAVKKFLLVAQLYNLRGEAAQAIRLLQRVIPMAPMDLSIRTQLIDLLRAQGRVDEAIEQYTNLAEVYYMLAELDLARQTYGAALTIVQEAKDSQTWATRILSRMADIDMQRMDMRNAQKVLSQLRSLKPEDAEVCLQLMDIQFKMQQDQAALGEADAFIAYQEKSGQPARAMRFIEEAMTTFPDKAALRKRLADALGRNGEVVRAVEEWDAIANALLDAGDRAGAISAVEHIIALNPPNADDYRRVLADLKSR